MRDSVGLSLAIEVEYPSHGRLVGMREATVNLVPHLTGIEKAELVAFLKTLNIPPLPAALTAQPAQP